MEQQIKERMVGAGVLVLAAVIFIPMLLSGPPPQRGDSPARAGGEPVGSPNAGSARSAAESGFSSRIVPLGAAPARGQSVAREAARPAARETTPLPSPVKALAKSSPVRRLDVSPSAKPEPQSKPQPAPKSSSKAISPTAAKGVRKAIAAPPTTAAAAGWVVQLGSFASSRNAHALRDRLKAKGYKAFARSSGSGAQAVTRVYVGPDASRERAQQRVTQLLAETRLKGIVIGNPN